MVVPPPPEFAAHPTAIGGWRIRHGIETCTAADGNGAAIWSGLLLRGNSYKIARDACPKCL